MEEIAYGENFGMFDHAFIASHTAASFYLFVLASFKSVMLGTGLVVALPAPLWILRLVSEHRYALSTSWVCISLLKKGF
jgi:multisubunit Na+/H+ antiporter MnhE subunit